MKAVAKVALVSLVIATVVYISAVVHANVNANTSFHNNADSQPYPHRYVLYAADMFEGNTPPTEWYTMEQLGIYDVIEYANGFPLHIAVDKEKEPFPLQEKQPIFLYKDKFYQVSALWSTPALSESAKPYGQLAIGGVLVAGWVFTGAMLFKLRKHK